MHGTDSPLVGLPQRKRWQLQPRYQIVMVMFFATLAMYVERVGFSIAFTAMAKDASLDESVKGTVLSAFYWGYAVSQVRGGESRPCMALHLRTQSLIWLPPASKLGLGPEPLRAQGQAGWRWAIYIYR